MRKLRTSRKGLSPIFAVLILIAIAVVSGIVIYMYTSGYLATMMGGGGAGQEKVTILSVASTTGGFTVTAKSVGGGDVIITDAIVKNAAGTALATPAVGPTTLLASGATNSITVTYAFTAGEYYTVTLVSKLGNTFVSSSFKA